MVQPRNIPQPSPVLKSTDLKNDKHSRFLAAVKQLEEPAPVPDYFLPVNKVRPNDIVKQSECQSFVRRIAREKKERQEKLDALHRK